jgi:solute carrier family 35 protein E1
VLRLVWYYFLLYFFTVVYNVANKKVLEFLPLPATVSAVQTLIGIPLFLPLWMLKSPRHLDTIDRSSLMKIALCHGLGNLATVYALQSGTVSFTHVIKSAEPLFTAILSIVIMKSSLSTAVYLSLLPIVFGVALASAKELSFSWFGFFAAMLSNFFYQLRMVLSKVSFNGTDDNKLSAANTFRVITIFSFIQLIPIALVLEGNQIIPAFYSMISHPEGLKFTLVNLLIAGGSFYFYNEVGFWILDLVHPVTHAVGNTIKRVVLVLASIIIFRNPVNNMGLIGSSIAIMGSFLYALASQKK